MDANTRVRYKEWTYFTFEPELSIGRPEDYEIYLPSPTYLGLLQNVKFEFALPEIYVSAVLREIRNHSDGVFKNDTILFKTPEILGTLKEEMISAIMERLSLPYNDAEQWLCSHWSNSTEESNDPYLNGMRISVDQPSNISMNSCLMLFSNKSKNSLVDLEDRTYRNGSGHKWIESRTNQTIRLELMTRFSLNDNQVLLISQWLRSYRFFDHILLPLLKASLEIESIDDLECHQWAMGDIFTSFSDIYLEQYYYGPPEFYYWSEKQNVSVKIGMITCKLLFRDSPNHTSILDPKSLTSFKASLSYAMITGDFTYLNEKWAISTYEEASSLMDYFRYISDTYSKPRIEGHLRNGSGIIIKRKASEWLWNYQDPLVSSINPPKKNPNFKHNRTSEEDARINSKFDIVYTGVKNISSIQMYDEWQETKIIDWMYPKIIDVYGSTEAGQFKPSLVHNFENLTVFQQEYMKSLKLIKIDEGRVKNIDTYMFTVDNSTWMSDESMNNFIDGFWNVSAKFNNSPMMISRPHFYGTSKYWSDKILDLMPKNESTDVTRIDIEPWTGRVVRLHKSIQMNLHISENALYFIGSPYHPDMIKDIVFPLLWVSQKMEISDPLAQKIVSEVYGGHKMRVILKFSIFGLVALLGLASAILLVTTIRMYKKRNRDYDLING